MGLRPAARIPLLLAAVLLSGPALLAPPALAAEEFLFHSIRATLLVADPEAAGERLAAWAEESGGYPLLTASNRILLRFPAAGITELRGLLASVAEELVEFQLEARDLREEILGLEAGANSREEILARNLAYLDRADVTGTLAIEREVMQLLEEIETLKGRLRKLKNDRRLALAEIYLNFLEQALPEDIPSSFSWINTLDFYRYMEGDFKP
jgi:hypothetical protein